MLRQTIYPHVESRLNQIAGFLEKQGISPNQLTLAGAALNFVTGIVYAKGYLIFGGFLLLLAGLGDLLDGPLARTSGKQSSFGAFLDSTVDRYSDFFIFGGLAVFFAREGEAFWFLVCMGILLGAFIVSYAKARAENFIKDCGVGFFGRAERIVLLALGTLLPFLLNFILLILLIGTHITAIRRIFHTRKSLAEPSSGS